MADPRVRLNIIAKMSTNACRHDNNQPAHSANKALVWLFATPEFTPIRLTSMAFVTAQLAPMGPVDHARRTMALTTPPLPPLRLQPVKLRS
jgi:hypothetical protein